MSNLNLKNPKEFYVQHGKNIFTCFNELSIPSCEDGSEPLMFHHGTFSRFHFALFNDARQVVTANISVSEMPGIFNAVQNQIIVSGLTKRMKGEAGDNTCVSPAYTVQINAGKLRGKTPAEALLESDANVTMLKNQQKWLEDNLQRYPKNAVQINAIKEALILYENGKLIQDTASANAVSSSKVDIYPGGLRPLVRRRKANGKAFVYQISIAMYDGQEKPIEVVVKNFYAPVIQKESGLLNVDAQNREDEVVISFRFSLNEWEWFRHQTETQMRTFENMYAPSLYKKACDADKENRFNAGIRG